MGIPLKPTSSACCFSGWQVAPNISAVGRCGLRCPAPSSVRPVRAAASLCDPRVNVTRPKGAKIQGAAPGNFARRGEPRMSLEWSHWRLFPDPRQRGVLVAPFGPGCYELRNGKQLVLYGQGGHVAHRMNSLLPTPWGSTGRRNREKREYVLKHLGRIEYRTLACATHGEAKDEERRLRSRSSEYLFPT
jgi:hypothetical protein